MANKVQVLDHGYLEEIEHWGSDERIIESARMSTKKGFLGWEAGPCPTCQNETELRLTCLSCEQKGVILGDAKLLKRLWDFKHATPFEFAGLTLEIQAPIVVFREWHRHRTQSYSELSARYTPLPDFNYMPTPERCLIVNASNKQAGKIKGSDELTHESVLEWLDELVGVYEQAERVYQSGLKRGIPKEVARLPVPVGRYSRMRATGNLRNWLGFLTLRMDLGAQYEIRMFANEVAKVVAERFPRTYALFIGEKE